VRIRRRDVSDDLNRKRILVADDENSVRRLLHEILGANFDVIEAQNGEEAVSLSQSQRPDLIVMDMIMPRMDGITACSLIRRDEITADIPVIMLTAIDHYLNRNLAENTGVNVYLTKPFNHHDLIRTVNELLTESTSNSRSTINS
jgi:two-component system alkaline phosphatase synthesis response regulator PhoP